MMTRTAFTGLIWIGLIAAALADQAPVRVAVISDADNQNLAALVTTELSSSPDISLVERDDLAKVGDELKLRQMAGSDAVTLGKLVGADGLLLLDKRVDGTHVRLTAVNLGYALFEEVVSEKTETVRQAQTIAAATRAYLPKLKLQSSAALPIAVLNLRADYATPATLELERNLTLLLESGLASVPRFVVLERRHAWSLGFERSLETPSNPLLDGAWLLDGTITLAATDSGEVTVHLRLRPPHGTERTGDIQGSAQDLPALVKKVVGQVQEFTGKEMAHDEWHPEKEAREYLLEGIWGYRHKVYSAALEALDSAELLGETAPQLFAVRSEVCGAISANDLNIEGCRIILPNGPSAQPAVTRADMIIRAIEDAVHFNEAIKAPGYVPDSELAKAWTYPNPGPEAVGYASYILVLLDRDDPAQSDRVRQTLRALTKFDPAHGIMGPYHMLSYAYTQDLFVEEWPATLDEELAALRVLCLDSKDWLPSVVFEQGKDFCPRFLKTPEEQKKQFDLFMQSFRDAPAARLRKLLIQSASNDSAEADAAYQAYLGELWSQHDTFAHDHGFPPDLACGRNLPDEVRRRNAAAGLPLLHYALSNSDAFRPMEIVLDIVWEPAGWSRDQATSVWKEYLAYKARPGGDESGTFLRDFEGPFKRQFPDLAVEASLPPPPTHALAVTRFWYSWRYAPVTPNCYYDAAILVTDDQSVWLWHEAPGESGELARVFLPDFKTQFIPAPSPNPQSFVRTSDALYTTWETHGHDGSGDPIAHQIARYDLKTSTWSTHDLPNYFGGDLYAAGDMLYLLVSLKWAGQEKALLRHDWKHDETKVLANTRRRPAQNQFDENPLLDYHQVFLGPGGKPCITGDEGTFYIRETPGPWPPVLNPAFGGRITAAGDTTLLTDPPGRIVLFDPHTEEPIPLMMPVESGSRPVKNPPTWEAKASWDAPGRPALYYDNVVFHDDCLFALVSPKVKGGAYDLLCYGHGQGRTPRHIPLVFHLDDQARADLLVKPNGAPATWAPGQIEHPDTTIYPSNGVHFFGTKEGLCIQPFNVGFWFLPYDDIDAYLKTNPEGESSSSSPASVPNRTSQTSTNPMEIDGFDPGDPSSFP